MKTIPISLSLATSAAVFLVFTSLAEAGRRQRPANPRGAYDPRGARDPRGAYDPRGVADPRGRYDPRNPAGYMYTLPTGYVPRVYGGATYYFCAGNYYYVYYINGRAVYVRCSIVNGVPVIPPRPY